MLSDQVETALDINLQVKFTLPRAKSSMWGKCGRCRCRSPPDLRLPLDLTFNITTNIYLAGNLENHYMVHHSWIPQWP